MIREVLEGIEDGTKAALISLDQSKAFDRVDHRFLATVLETAGFKPEFRRGISMMYHNPQAVVQVNGRRLRVFMIEHSVQQGCPLSPLLYVLALEPLLLALLWQGFPRLSMISQCLYPAKVCGSVLGGVAILSQGPSAGVTDASASSGCGSGPTSNWSVIGQKYKLR